MIDLQPALVTFLRHHGWIEPDRPGAHGGLWRHPSNQSTVPVPHHLSADTAELSDILARVAGLNDVTIGVVRRAVLQADTDIVQLRAANPLVIRDTIPFASGAALAQQGWRMLRTCATTARGPRSDIAGRYLKAADEVVGRARMAHTQEGSYVIPIYLPMTPQLPDAGTLELGAVTPDPPERRVTRTFASALSAVERLVVRPDQAPGNDDLHELLHQGVSRELLHATTEVLTSGAIDVFETGFDWAPDVPTPPSMPASVAVPAAAAPLIREAAHRLPHHDAASSNERLQGQVIGVARDPGTQDGQVTVHTYRHGREARVHVPVSPTVLELALTWMRTRDDVVVHGRIARGSGGLVSDQRNGVTALSSHHLGGS